MQRIFIAGGPRTGKTTLAGTLAAELGVPLIHTDDFIPMGWGKASAHVAALMAADGPLIIEGVTVPRALRRLLAADPDRVPCERLIILRTPHVPLTVRQAAMTKGLDKILRELLPELRRRGVEVVRGGGRGRRSRALAPSAGRGATSGRTSRRAVP